MAVWGGLAGAGGGLASLFNTPAQQAPGGLQGMFTQAQPQPPAFAGLFARGSRQGILDAFNTGALTREKAAELLRISGFPGLDEG